MASMVLMGLPLLGFLFDYSGSYDSGFLLMGVMIALSGLMLYPIPCIKNALNEVMTIENVILRTCHHGVCWQDLDRHKGSEPLRQEEEQERPVV